MKITFKSDSIDHTLLNGPEDWEKLVADQRRIENNPVLHRNGSEPHPSEYPCLALIDGTREGGFGIDQMNVFFIPNVEVLDPEDNDGED